MRIGSRPRPSDFAGRLSPVCEAVGAGARLRGLLVLPILPLLLCLACASGPPSPPSPTAASTLEGAARHEPPAEEAAPGSGAGDGGPALERAGPLTPQETSFFEAWLSKLVFLVYYSDSSGSQAKAGRAATLQANRWLADRAGLKAIGPEKVEENLPASAPGGSATGGPASSPLLRIARGLGADICVEIAFAISADTRQGIHLASAQGELRLYDVATAALLGALPFVGQPSLSPSSDEAAAIGALSSTLWSLMPQVVAETKRLESGLLGQGLGYEMVIRSAPRTFAVSAFRASLAEVARKVGPAGREGGELRMSVSAFLSPEGLSALVMAAAGRSGLSSLKALSVGPGSLVYDASP